MRGRSYFRKLLDSRYYFIHVSPMQCDCSMQRETLHVEEHLMKETQALR